MGGRSGGVYVGKMTIMMCFSFSPFLPGYRLLLYFILPPCRDGPCLVEWPCSAAALTCFRLKLEMSPRYFQLILRTGISISRDCKVVASYCLIYSSAIRPGAGYMFTGFHDFACVSILLFVLSRPEYLGWVLGDF